MRRCGRGDMAGTVEGLGRAGDEVGLHGASVGPCFSCCTKSTPTYANDFEFVHESDSSSRKHVRAPSPATAVAHHGPPMRRAWPTAPVAALRPAREGSPPRRPDAAPSASAARSLTASCGKSRPVDKCKGAGGDCKFECRLVGGDLVAQAGLRAVKVAAAVTASWIDCRDGGQQVPCTFPLPPSPTPLFHTPFPHHTCSVCFASSVSSLAVSVATAAPAPPRTRATSASLSSKSSCPSSASRARADAILASAAARAAATPPSSATRCSAAAATLAARSSSTSHICKSCDAQREQQGGRGGAGGGRE
eukprot:30041-Chlamydomonas_euryale.AAC.2